MPSPALCAHAQGVGGAKVGKVHRNSCSCRWFEQRGSRLIPPRSCPTDREHHRYLGTGAQHDRTNFGFSGLRAKSGAPEFSASNLDLEVRWADPSLANQSLPKVLIEEVP